MAAVSHVHLVQRKTSRLAAQLLLFPLLDVGRQPLATLTVPVLVLRRAGCWPVVCDLAGHEVPLWTPDLAATPMLLPGTDRALGPRPSRTSRYRLAGRVAPE